MRLSSVPYIRLRLARGLPELCFFQDHLVQVGHKGFDTIGLDRRNEHLPRPWRSTKPVLQGGVQIDVSWYILVTH